MAVPQYLIENRENILNYNQNYDDWINLYEIFNTDEYPEIQRIYREFYENNVNSLTRLNIKTLFQNALNDEDYFYAFLSVMVWGAYIKAGPRKRKISQLISFFNNRNSIVSKLRLLKDELNRGNLRNGYNGLLVNGNLNIPNIATAFFTKILYFADSWIPADFNIVKPLIFDTVQFENFFKLNASDLNENEFNYQQLYTYNQITRRAKIRNTRAVSFNLYELYINKYSLWAQHLSEIYNLNITSEAIEKFTFGTSRENQIEVNGQLINNPRKEIRNL